MIIGEEFIVDGKIYIQKEETSGCDGCIAQNNDELCFCLPAGCSDDGLIYIEIEKCELNKKSDEKYMYSEDEVKKLLLHLKAYLWEREEFSNSTITNWFENNKKK